MKKIVSIILMLGLLIPQAFASQHDYVIDNAPGAGVRADINSVLQAVVTQNAGSTAPSPTFPNMFWYDTSTATLKKRSNANDAWVAVHDGSNFSGLANIVSGAGVIPIANIPSITDAKLDSGVGTSANNLVKLSASAKLPAVDGSLLTGLPPQKSIGSISGKTVNTVYQAATDGFAVLRGYSCANNGGFQIYTDSSNPPTTSLAYFDNSQGAYSATVPIKSGNYYKLTSTNGTGTGYFVPLS